MQKEKNKADIYKIKEVERYIFYGFLAVCGLVWLSFVFSGKETGTPYKITAEEKALNSVLKLNKDQRVALYMRLADNVCNVRKKQGSAIYYEQCMKEEYVNYYQKWEAEVKLAKGTPYKITAEEKALNSVLKLNKDQRIVLYSKLAENICSVHKKPGSALYYEQCLTEQYADAYQKWEAEVRLANQYQ